jgi:hypothetical protein
LTGSSAQAGELIAQSCQIVHGAIDCRVPGSDLSVAKCASRVAHLLAQLLQIIGERSFGRIGELPTAQPVRTALHAGSKIVFVHATECAPQLGRRPRLRGRKLARCVADSLRKTRQIIRHLLAIVDHFVDVLSGRIVRLPACGGSGFLLRNQVAHVIRLLLLTSRQLLGRLSHRVETAGRILLLETAKQIGGLTQSVGRTPGIGRAGILRDGAPHIFVGLAQALERPLGSLLTAIGGLVRGLLGIVG